MLTKFQKLKRNTELEKQLTKIIRVLEFFFKNTSQEIKDELEIGELLQDALIYLNSARFRIEAENSRLTLDSAKELLDKYEN